MASAWLVASAIWWSGVSAPAGVPAPPSITFVGADVDGDTVRLFDASGSPAFDFMPYAAGYKGGVRVAVGDVNGDGAADMIVAPGTGAGPHVKVFDGVTGALSREFFPFDSGFLGGVYVAAGDVNGDGTADIIVAVGPAAGTSGHVKVFSGRSGGEIRSFFAYPGFSGGVTVAAGDVNGDGRADIITGAASESAGHVKVFDGRSGAELRSFLAYDAGFTGGVFVGGGDIDGDGFDDIITGAGPAESGGPHVKVFSGADHSLLASFLAYSSTFKGGVRVGAGDVNGDGVPDVITAPGSGLPPTVNRYIAPRLMTVSSIDAFDPQFTGGVFVAGLFTSKAVFADSFEPE